MPTTRLVLPACVMALAAVGGCKNDEADARGGSCEQFLPGDLVITEIMANPTGSDTGFEWFEILNPTEGDMNLAGMVLIASKPDGSSQDAHEVTDLLIPAGGYAVVGGLLNEEDLLPPHIQYGYARDLGDFTNSAGRLVIACDTTVIEDTLYDGSTEGASRIYTGDRTPDAVAADDLNFWCDSTVEYAPDALGSPGAPNEVCEGVGSPTECLDNGEIRAVLPPTAGNVVISEYMPNPSAVGDNEGEWVEIYFAEDADLNGLEISRDGDDADTILSTECQHFTAGSYAVVARNSDMLTNGELPQVDGIFDFSLGNSSGTLNIGYGGTILDTVTWTGSGDGEATQLDPDLLTPEANDDENNLCDASVSYGAGDKGTPGAENSQCLIPAPPGQCFEPDGSTRALVSPGAGDLLITEFHANPDSVDDADGEWIEVRANATFDLNGLEVRREADDDPVAIEAGDCIAMEAGDYAVIARGFEGNGGLPVVDGLFSQSLVNSNGRLSVGIDGEELDVITWSSSTAGVATQLAPGLTDPSENDDEANWCDSTEAYGDGDLGSPGTANGACGGVGNGMCLDGDTERKLVAPSMGDLVITEVMANPDAVGDTAGEYFEVKNTSGSAVDLNGMQFGFNEDDSSGALPGGGTCLSVDGGAYAVLVRSDVTATNGGLPADGIQLGMSLGNSTRTLWVGYDEAHWDELTYDDAIAGVSWSVDPDSETPAGNDDPNNICESDMPYGDGDLGSPGTAGPACGPGVEDGMCLDGGVPRAIVPPVAGDLVLNEWMANPAAVDDGDGEWFELFVGANVDLNGLELSRGGTGAWGLEQTLVDADCLSVAAGTYVLFSVNDVAATNGGLPAVDFEMDFGLNNSNNGLAVGLDGTFLDEVDYSASAAGSSTQLDPGSQTPAGNDNIANLCTAAVPYGDGDNGTPGAPNPGC